MVTATLELSAAQTDIAVCVDEDDPEREAYADICWENRPRVIWHLRPAPVPHRLDQRHRLSGSAEVPGPGFPR